MYSDKYKIKIKTMSLSTHNITSDKNNNTEQKLSLIKQRNGVFMRNIKLMIEYDGSRYQGWTRLGKDESGNTISNKILEVLRKMTGEDDIELFCGCRTEVGVHAYAQIANFKTSCDASTKNIKHYLNRYLPMDIAILDVKEMPERFHAQLNATSKTYVYRMTIDDVPSVFDRKYTYHCYRIPDKHLMQLAAEQIVGKHDFRADFQHFPRGHGLHGGGGTHRHIHRGVNIAVRRVQKAQPGPALLAGFQHFKRKIWGTHWFSS